MSLGMTARKFLLVRNYDEILCHSISQTNELLLAKVSRRGGIQGLLGGSVSKHPTLDFGSCHDPMVHEIDPHVSLCAECRACLGFSLYLSLCPSPTHACSLSLKNKYINIKIKKKERNVPSAVLGWNVLSIYFKSICSSMPFKAIVSLLTFCVDDLSIDVSGLFMPPNIIVLLAISSFMFTIIFVSNGCSHPECISIYNC